MKKVNFSKVLILLIAGLMLFASCKHGGLPVKGGAVQVEVTLNGRTETVSVPIPIYDAISNEMEKIAKYYNEDKILTEKQIDQLKDFSYKVWSVDFYDSVEYPEEIEESLLTIIDKKDVKSVMKYLGKQTEKSIDNLTGFTELASTLMDVPINILMELYDQTQGWGYCNSKEELYDYLESNEDYKNFLEITPQLFPKIKFNKK